MHKHGADPAFFVLGVVLCIADEMTGIAAANVRNLLVGLFECVIRDREDHALVDTRVPVPPHYLLRIGKGGPGIREHGGVAHMSVTIDDRHAAGSLRNPASKRGRHQPALPQKFSPRRRDWSVHRTTSAKPLTLSGLY